MSRFGIDDTPLPGLKRIQRKPVADERGAFARLFCAEELAAAGWHWPVAQANHSLTRQRGAVRGLHFQHPPHGEAKLVTCLRGAAFDVAVDLRAGSPTFLHWHAERLTPDAHRALLIPPGFAHGFQALTEDVELIYLTSAAYAPTAEGGVSPVDPRLKIDWPQAITLMSARDAAHPFLEDGFQGLRL